MWPWPSNSCPLDPVTKGWLEKRWRWLTDEFGDDVLLNLPYVLPTPEFFPDPYDASDDSAETMGRRVCEYMQVPAELVDFEFFSDPRSPQLVNSQGLAIGGAAGTFQDGS